MAPVEMYMRWADLVTVWEVLYVSNFIQNWNWWEVLYMSNLIQTLYLRSCGKFWRQRWMLHSKLDTGNKLSTQTPSSAQWMGTRGHLKSVFTCVVIWISGASSHNCSYNDYRTRVRSLGMLVPLSFDKLCVNKLLKLTPPLIYRLLSWLILYQVIIID